MRVHCIQHVPFEGPARVADWARARGHTVRVSALYAGDPLPSRSEFDLLVVMGGPMSVHDEAEYSWLRLEKRLLRVVLEAEGSVLGICLGAQLIAEGLGANVHRQDQQEIGWYPVHWSQAARDQGIVPAAVSETVALHWHGETFTLPDGAQLLASSEACRHQAFRFGRALALQFHLEMDPPAVEAIVRHCGAEIGAGVFEQDAATILRDTAPYADSGAQLFSMLDRIYG
jgi:GMP synthase-like glutamine amidotransferase